MDELELLKKDWDKQKPEHKKLSATDIYPMLQKKSSSIVKTLFYISVAELLFWIVVGNASYFSENYESRLNTVFNQSVFIILDAIFYLVILIFIYLLFKSYKSISATDNAKKLMESILNTRKIIKYYVIYNLAMVFIVFIITIIYAITNDPEIANKFSHYSDKKITLITTFAIVVIGIFMLIIWLFYKLIYGLLLKRLNRNYNELKKLEV